MSVTMEYTETLVVTHCWCGIALAYPENLDRYAREHGTDVYCPLGHVFVFKSENAQLRRELDQAKQRIRATKDLLAAEERSHRSTRGQLTKARKRAAAGVCPCCKRHFVNVERHVQNKHPDFKPEEMP